MALGSLSKPIILVAPVVVNPEKDSKNAEAIVKSGSSNKINGIAPKLPITTQKATTIKNPSRDRSSSL